MPAKNALLGMAIFILVVFVGAYGINTFYEDSPDFNSFCNKTIPINEINEKECAALEGVWQNYLDYPSPAPKENLGGYCDFYSKCQGEYNLAKEKHSRGIFLIALPLGVIIIVAGVLLFGLDFVGAGLVAGGLGVIIYGAGGFWSFADDWLKFILSLLVFIFIILFSYFWTKRKNKKSNKK